MTMDTTAMPERDQETVTLFIDESLEALQRIEQLLLDAEAGRPAVDLTSILFRDVHTMKGTAGFLAYERTQRLAHAVEDLLSQLRDGKSPTTKRHYVLLVASMDLLRNLVAAIKATGEEGATEVEQVIAELRDIVAQPVAAITGDAVTPVSEHVAVRSEAEPAETLVAGVTDVADGTVRVNVGVLDRLMNLIGELVLARNQMVQMVKTSRDISASSQAACQRLNLVTSDLQEQIMKTRMQPVGRVFEKIPRVVRDVAQQSGKQVQTRIDGTSTEIDKALVEAVRDPLLHIVRNAVDHGIERPDERVRLGKTAIGRLSIAASHEGGTVAIEVADDGRGMDPDRMRAHAAKKGLMSEAEAQLLSDREALELIFQPGFSTAEKITGISGRGVGMDVVRTHVERAGGQVEIESTPGKGTTIRMKMPLTLAIIPALLVRAAGQQFAISQVNLLELVYLDDEQAATALEHVRGAMLYRLRGEMLPLVQLSSILRLPAREHAGGVNIVVVAAGSVRYGLVIDEIHDTEEIVIKPLHGQLKRIACYSGATVLGDGGVALILEVAGVAALAGVELSSLRSREIVRSQKVVHSGPQSYLVCEAGDGSRCAIPLAMVARLEQVPVESIERAAGAELLQYRDSIMRIVRPERVLPLGAPPAGITEQPLVVFDFGQKVGLAVNRIVDVVQVDTESVQPSGESRFIHGRSVLLGTTTLLIDVYAIVRELVPQFVQERRRATRRPRVLLMDDSVAMRAALASFLRNENVDVTHIESDKVVAELRAAQAPGYDALVLDIDAAGTVSTELIAAARAEREHLPIFVWTFSEDVTLEEQARAAGACAWISKMAREQLVEAMEAAGVLPRRRKTDVRSAA